jgi:hypothetical protein
MPDWAVTFVTTTAYGSWLPGDTRGYVQNGELLPANPALEWHARSLLKHYPDPFSQREQQSLFEAIVAACNEFNYRLLELSLKRGICTRSRNTMTRFRRWLAD